MNSYWVLELIKYVQSICRKYSLSPLFCTVNTSRKTRDLSSYYFCGCWFLSFHPDSKITIVFITHAVRVLKCVWFKSSPWIKHNNNNRLVMHMCKGKEWDYLSASSYSFCSFSSSIIIIIILLPILIFHLLYWVVAEHCIQMAIS